MKIVADENIPGVRELCGGFGALELFDGRSLSSAQLKDAEILLVRSITRVNRALLANTPVRYVGSATAGIDHVDTDYLAAQHIEFAHAPGANAIAVAEYVAACCVAYCVVQQRQLAKLRIGIVGFGHVGTAVAQRLRALGMTLLINDPPRAAVEGSADYCTLDDVLAADVVSLHIPLTQSGPHPTLGMIGARELSILAPHALLINAARGRIVDELCLSRHAALFTVIDCWCNEPNIEDSTLAAAWIATPHIAGHTVEARVRATEMLAQALARFLAQSPAQVGLVLPPGNVLRASGAPTLEIALHQILSQCCDLTGWTAEMKQQTTPGIVFDRLRRQYGVRREFASYTIRDAAHNTGLRTALAHLGFHCDE